MLFYTKVESNQESLVNGMRKLSMSKFDGVNVTLKFSIVIIVKKFNGGLIHKSIFLNSNLSFKEKFSNWKNYFVLLTYSSF